MASKKNLNMRTLAASAGIVGIGAAAFALTPVASAHDVVLSSNPENGSVIDEFPETIELEFSGVPQDLFTTVALSNADSGEVLTSGSPQLVDQHLTFEVPSDLEAGNGNYILGFQITSSDGHATKGSIEFEVASAADAPTTTTTTTTPVETATEPSDNADSELTAESEESSGISAPWNWLLAIAGVFVIGGAIVMMIAKNRNQK
nr:copper resistance protein CopC [Corynebacterium deserti]